VRFDRKVAIVAGVGGLVGAWLDASVRSRGHTRVQRSSVDAALDSRASRPSADRSGGADLAPCDCPDAFHELGVHRPGYEPPGG
jgi:hypothetical protein